MALGACGSDDGDDDDSSGGGPDGAAMAEAFGERAEAAYEAQGLNRDEDFTQGLLLDECFVLSPDAAEAVGEAAGATGPAFRIAETNYLSGAPGENETLNCSLPSGGERIAVVAGTTWSDDNDRGRSAGPGNLVRYVWTQEHFLVSVNGSLGKLERKEGFAALQVAVDGVAQALSG